ncbi:hypothetical protein V5O39_11690 [Pseudomonas parakoreensis]
MNNGIGSRIASERALTATVTGFDQQGGQLFSKTSLSLDLNYGQLNNRNGLINAPLLVLKISRTSTTRAVKSPAPRPSP